MAKAVKYQGNILDWTLLPDTVSDSPSVDSGQHDVGEGAIDVELSIKVAHIDTNAAGINFVTIKVLGKYGPNDEDWGLLSQIQSGGGTAVKEDLNALSAAGQNRIEVADTTDWDTGLGERLFLLDATLVNSEIVEIFGWIDADCYLAIDNLTNSHQNTADLLNGLSEHRVYIPNGIRYVKVVFHNSDDDAEYAVKVDFSRVTEFK